MFCTRDTCATQSKRARNRFFNYTRNYIFIHKSVKLRFIFVFGICIAHTTTVTGYTAGDHPVFASEKIPAVRRGSLKLRFLNMNTVHRNPSGVFCFVFNFFHSKTEYDLSLSFCNRFAKVKIDRTHSKIYIIQPLKSRNVES